MRIDRPRPSPVSVRLANGVTAAVHFVLLGMVLYLRLGPIERVLRRLDARPGEMPAWIPLVFTGATLLISLFLLWRGIRLLRAALRPA